MAISRVPGYSLLANLDRQGTDLAITSSGLTLTYWDVVQYRFGINTTAPLEDLHVNGNILAGNGHVYSGANISYDLGKADQWWRTVYAETITSENLTGVLLTNAQPNITSVGDLDNLTVLGNLSAANLVGTIYGDIYGTLLTNAQPNITSVGILTALTVNGNIDATNIDANVYGNVTGTILTASQPNITEVGTLVQLNVLGNVLATNVVATYLEGTLTTASQPNITEVGTLGNLTVEGTLAVNDIQLGGDIAANTITANSFVGTISTAYQPYISNLGNITVDSITIGGNITISGNTNGGVISADELYEAGYRVLTANTDISVNGDVVGSGKYSNVYVELPTTGVTAGLYGAAGATNLVSLTVDTKGRVTDISNVALTSVGNITFTDTVISSNSSITIQSANNGNIIIDANGNGIVQISGTDALGMPAGPTENRPVNPEIGYTRFNTTFGAIEYWDGATWSTPGLSTMSSETINPNGTDDTYTLSANATTDGVLVSINGTVQQPTTAYEIVGDQITFSEIPLVTDIIEVRKVASGIVTVQSLHYGTADVTLDLANVNVTGNILPSANVTYSLGSESYQWKDLWVSGNTIYIGGAPVTVANGQLSLGGNIIGAAEPFGNVNVAAYIATNSGDITALGTITSGTWNADTLAVVYGGTGATTSADALNNLLPSGEQTGYVLTTSGAGSYYWASAGGGGGATVGQSLTTLRQSNTATSGQTVFELVNDLSYTPGTGQLRVYIDGVRQFPDAYTETSSNAYTLSTGVSAGAEVFAEIDAFSTFNNYANLTYASNVGNIAASGLTVQSAIDNLENNKAPLAHPVFTGVTTVSGNLVVQGNLFVNGNVTSINANNLSISDSMIYLADDNPADTLDIGIVSSFTDAVRYQHTGLVRDATDGTWKLFANVVAEPTTTVDFTNATYANLQVGNLSTTSDISVSGNLSLRDSVLVPTYGGDYNNHLTFQSSTADDSTRIQVAPSGAGIVGQIAIASGSNIANASVLELTTVSSLYTRIESGRHGNGTRLPLDFYVGGARQIRVETSGNVLISGNIISTGYINTSGNVAAQTVNAGNTAVYSLGVGTPASSTMGEIRAINNITAYYASDKKYKENIQDIPDAMDKVNAIGGKLFDWTDEYLESHGGEDGYFLRKSDFGVIAQDVQAVFPEAVRVRPDGTLAVDYEKLAALSFAALKELSIRVSKLEGK